MVRGEPNGGKEAPRNQRFCVTTPDFRFIEDCARILDGEILKHFEKSCFGHFRNLPKVVFFPHLVHYILLKRKDYEGEEEDAMSFIIGSQEICFGEREFAMMSGLKFQGTDEIVQKPKEEIRLMKDYFPGKDNVTLDDLMSQFYGMKNSEDKLKLGLVAIVENAIAGNYTRRYVNTGHFLLVDNLGEFNSYPWGKLFYKVTRDSLIRAKGKVAYRLNGFPHVFQAWIFESIPSLKRKYTVENKNCPLALHPRILHMEMPQHKIEVLSTLQLTQEEVKESYMAGLLTEVDISGVRGHEKDSGAEDLRYEDNSTEQREVNHCCRPMNSSKVDKRSGTSTKEHTALSNDEDHQDVRSLENLKLNLRNEINLLNKEKSVLESDVGSLTKTRKELETDRCKLTKEKTVHNKEKLKLEREIESLNREKTKLGTDTDLLKKEQSTLQGGVCLLNERKATLESEIGALSNEKTNIGNETELLDKKKKKLQSDFELLKKEQSTVQGNVCSLNQKKTSLESKIESLRYEKTNLRNDNQLLDKEKTRLQTETEFFNKGKMELRSDFEFLDQEKAKLGKDVEKLKERKCEVEIDFGFLQNEKNKLHSDIESLNQEKAKLDTDFEVTNKEKDKLDNDIESLNKEKDKLQSDIEYFNEEKAEFVRSVTSDVNESFYQREKTLAENEKMFIELKEKNPALVANSKELQEARQELIKVMVSEKVTKSTVIGVRKRGDPELWNFRENKKATLKEAISFQLNRKDK